MSLLRVTFLRTAPRATSLNVASRRFASGDYGSGAVKPGTPNNAVDQEHPGPAPPSVADKGKSGGDSTSGQTQESGSDKQQGSSSSSSSSGKSTSDAQPKISNPKPPADGQYSEDVVKHNREMEQRADKTAEKASSGDAKDDKVPKGFWSGQGGRDRDP